MVLAGSVFEPRFQVMSEPKIILGLLDAATSGGALEWAIAESAATTTQLVVVHASSSSVSVSNGPSRSIAHQLGDPAWAIAHSIVWSFDPPPDTVTHVRPGRAVEVLASFADEGDLIVLGPRRSRWFSRDTAADLRSKVGCEVIRVDETEAASSNRRGRLDRVKLAA